MGVKERREREKQELRDKIMEAARTIFLAEGYESVSMRRIADAIEYSPASIYAYFPDKDSLFLEICRNDFRFMHEAMGKLDAIVDPVDRLRQIGLGYIRFAVQYPKHYKLMFMTTAPVKADATCMAGKGDPDQDSYEVLNRSIQAAIDAGVLRPELTDVELIAQVLWAGVHGVASLQITHEHDPWISWRPLEDRATLMVDSVMRGLLRDPTHIERVGRPKSKHRVQKTPTTARTK